MKSAVGSKGMASLSGREFLLEVIEKYRQYPCLWQVTNEDYRDKVQRNRALDDILDLFKTKDPRASRETVQKKLASLRGSYNKELRKVQASLNTGSDWSDPDNVHVPKLWYFGYLNFLQDDDAPRNSKTDSSMLSDMPFDDEVSYDPLVDHASPNSQHSSSSRSSTRFKRPQPAADQVLDKIPKRVEQPIVSVPTPSVEKPKQEHDSFGNYVAEKLRSLPTSMVPFCQKIINDAIFFSEMQSLNISSRIVTDPDPHIAIRKQSKQP